MKPGQHPLEKMDPNQRMTLKHFKESDFHEVCGMREEFTSVGRVPDAEEGHGFRKGDKVQFGVFNIGTFRNDEVRGVVTGICGSFVRVGTELYHPGRLKKV